LRPAPFLSALRHRDFRLFLFGQFVSLNGTWIQTVAQGWLVLQLTDSAFAVGLVTTLGSLPILFFTLLGGVVADRVDKRRLVLLLQCGMLLEALALAVLTQGGWITVELVMVLAVFFGLLSAFEVPTRQSLVAEIVGREDLMNAIALGSTGFNLARVIGPAIAGALIATLGVAACFYANAVTYVAVIAALLLMRVRRADAAAAAPALGALLEGVRYIRYNRLPRALISLITVFTIFGYSFVTMMPVFARDVLRLDAAGYGALVSGVGVGAVVAALGMAGLGRRVPMERLVIGSSLLFGVLLTAASFAPELWSALALFTLTGCTVSLNGISSNTTLQLQAPDHLRGRVIGFYSFTVLGMAPFGSLQAGWVSEHFGVRTSMALGGVVCLVTAVGMWMADGGWRRADSGGRIAEGG
jgi:MFS family permease